MATQNQLFEVEQTFGEEAAKKINGKHGFESPQFSLQFVEENITSFMIGWFYEILTRTLIGIPVSNDEMWRIWKEIRISKPFDLKCGSFWFEIKGFSNNNRPKYFENQFDCQLEELDRMADEEKNIDPIAMIFFYRNRIQNNHSDKVVMPKGLTLDDKDTLFEILANNTMYAFAIDMRFLDVLRSAYGTFSYKRRKNGQIKQSLILKRRDLRKITLNIRGSLEDLGISEDEHFWLPPGAKGIRTRRVETEVCGHKISFNLFPLLPIPLRKKFFRMLNLNGTIVTKVV